MDRAAFFEQAREFTPLLAVDGDDGARFLVSTGDESVGRSLFESRSRGEMNLLRRTRALLDERGLLERAVTRTLLDVGANIGTTTVAALMTHGFAKAIAIEPGPENFRLLRLNVVVNGLEGRVRTLQLAVSDADGRAELALNPRKGGDHRMLDWLTAAKTAQKRERIKVRRVALDTMIVKGVLDAQDIGLLWIDTQGHEGHVLNGARHLLEQGVPIVMEFDPALLAQSKTLESTIALLGQHYSEAIELRGRAGTDAAFAPQRLHELAERYGHDRASRFTNILVLPPT